MVRVLPVLAAAGLGGLAVLLSTWVLLLDPPPPALRAPALAGLVTPLLLALPGVLRARRYTLAWSSLLIMAYFIHGSFYVAGTGSGRWLGALELALVAIHLSASSAFLRYTRRPAKAQ